MNGKQITYRDQDDNLFSGAYSPEVVAYLKESAYKEVEQTNQLDTLTYCVWCWID